MKDVEILKETLEINGADCETNVAMEECAELIQAISKCKRYKCDGEYRNNLIEEIADVLICIDMLKLIYKIDDYEIINWINAKLLRQEQRNSEENIPLF